MADDNNGALWSLPKGVDPGKIPVVDIVGDKLQALVKKYAANYKESMLSPTEQAAIKKAFDEKQYWLANLLKAQAKGRIIERQVRDEAKITKELSHLDWRSKGIDITDPKTGITYDVMSDSDNNIRTHVMRMPNTIWRLITF